MRVIFFMLGQRRQEWGTGIPPVKGKEMASVSMRLPRKNLSRAGRPCPARLECERFFSCGHAGSSGAGVEDGHANSNAVGDLLKDHALVSIGYIAIDFHTTVDRAGVHNEAGRLELCSARFGEAEEGHIFAKAGEVFLALALVLDAKEVDDIDVLQNVIEAMGHADAEFFEAFRNEG
jgi:hypothetical protein